MKKIYTTPVLQKINAITKVTLGNTGSTTADGSNNAGQYKS